jgi:hypothetical protein
MGLIDIIKNIISGGKKIDIKRLPSQGYFYPIDFEIKLKKASEEDIIDYEFNYDKENILEVIESVKKIVLTNTTFSSGYKFEDLKSVDIVFLFLEIVKYTTNRNVNIEFFNDDLGRGDSIPFDYKNFQYFNLEEFKEFYDEVDCSFLVDGYKFAMPSIGVENSLTNYLLSISNQSDSDRYNYYSYDFLFFLGRKNNLTFSEIENLITIFNFDIDDEERKRIKSIIKKFIEIIEYNLKVNNNLVDVKSRLDLENIWKVES